MDFSKYTTKTEDELLDILGTRAAGLSEKEARERQESFGLNEIRAKKEGMADILLRQMKSPFFYLLLTAAIVAFLIDERTNALIVLFFVLINTLIGFFQEARAYKALNILKGYIPSTVRVLRQGKEKAIEQKFLVPGDIVLIEGGNIAPADLRLIKQRNLLVDEEALTGESAPVAKESEALLEEAKEIFEAKNIVFTATSIVSGEAEGVVIATSKETVFGEIARIASEAVKESAYGKNILYLSRVILKIVISSIAGVFFLNYLLKGNADILDFLIFCVALVVSIIPEALPAVITFALSDGALKLAKNRVVVKRLSAIEDLGDIEILCTDKTGTITENKLSLVGLFSKEAEKCFLYALLCSPFFDEDIESSGNSFDSAIFEKAPLLIKKGMAKFKQLFEAPFDNERARNSALVEDPLGRKLLIVKGAPEIIISLCRQFPKDVTPEVIGEKVRKEGEEGKRVLALGFKEFEKETYSPSEEADLTFLGYFSFEDPLKQSAKEAIVLSRRLGVDVKIITGDAKEVAGAVAREVGLVKDSAEVILGKELQALPEEEFLSACKKFKVFARITPQVKFKIVQSLQKEFEVGFLGEGVNDAPALKLANVAIAVKEGSDISREVSDIVLLKKDLKAIVEGIKIGRNIFSNINKYIKCTIASNFGNFYSISAISLFVPFLPMLPVQILFVNMLSDFPLIAVAGDSVDAEELRKPKMYQISSLTFLIVALALVSTVFDFAFFFIFRKYDISLMRTLWFVESILTEILLIFVVRSRKFFAKAKAPSFILLFLSILTVFVTILLPFTNLGKNVFDFRPPSFLPLAVLFGLLLGYFFSSEAVKLIFFRFWENRLFGKNKL